MSDGERSPRRSTVEALADLNQRQLRVLTHAVAEGFFNRPPERTAAELAEDLDLSRESFLRRLRSAEQDLFAGHFYTRDTREDSE
jgi:predicted DNA binding protein